MRAVLLDVSLASAAFEQNNVADSIRQISYQEVFDKHKITQTDWDSSMAWYSKNDIEVFNNIHQTVRDSLQRLQVELNKIHTDRTEYANHLALVSSGAIDSTNFLNKPISYWTTDGKFLNEYFTFSPSLAYDSTYRVAFTVRLSGMPRLKQTLQMQLTLHMTDSTAIIQSLEIKRAGLYQLELDIPNGKTTQYITGFIRGLLPKLQPSQVFALDSISLIRLPSKQNTANSPISTKEGLSIDPSVNSESEVIDSAMTIEHHEL